MTVESRFKTLFLITTLWGMVVFALASSRLELGIFGVVAGAVGWRLTEGAFKFRPPAWLTGGVILLVVGVEVLLGYGSGSARFLRIGELVILVQVIKLFDQRSCRDYRLFIWLTIVLGISAMMISSHLLVGLMVLALLALIIVTSMLYQLYATHDAILRERSREVGSTSGRKRLSRFGRTARRDLRRVGIASTVLAMVFGGFVFLMTPRGIGADSLGRWVRAVSGTTVGFTDRIRLGAGSGLISQSNTPVLDLRVEDEDGNALGSPGSIYYLRGAVLDSYNDGVWNASTTTTIGYETVPGERAILDRGVGSAVIQHIRMRDVSTDTTPLFAMWRPVSITFPKAASFRFDDVTSTLTQDPHGTPATEYTVRSLVAERNAIESGQRGWAAFRSDVVRHAAEEALRLDGIESAPTLRDVSDDVHAARAIERYLRQNYTYTLEQAIVPSGIDPTDWFLSERKKGHCEYFASAMAAMCRSVGIPARVVSGYVSAEFNETSGHYVVRESNAHAWVEVEVRAGLWRAYDPSPPGDIRSLHVPESSVMTRVRGIFGALEYAWVRSVVAFDEGSRQRVLSGEGVPGGQFIERLRAAGDQLKSGDTAVLGRALRNGTIAFIAVLALGSGLIFLARFLRRVRQGESSAAASDGFGGMSAQPAFYRTLLKHLRRQGYPKPGWMTPLSHVRSIGQADPDLGDRAEKIVHMYYRLQYASGDTEALKARAASLVRDLVRPET